MKKYLKVFVALFIILFSIFSSTIFASSEDKEAVADYLKEIGLFQGTGESYDLDKTTNRAQGATMIVRLLGKEREALLMNYSHPFEDVPTWANPYVGYLYYYDISNGIDEYKYGANKLINASEYMTFLIRTLGHDDNKGDFSWNQSLEKAYSLGIIDYNTFKYYNNNNSFLRGDMVLLSYKALQGDIKNKKGNTLIKSLINENIIPQNSLLEYKYAPYNLKNINYSPANREQLRKSIIESIMAFKSTVIFDFNSNIDEITQICDEAIYELRKLPGYSSIVDSWSFSLRNNKLTINFNYRINKNQFIKSQEVAESIIKKKITNKMTDYEKELLIHDYIIDQTIYYDNQSDKSIFTIYGVFIENKAVCQGYADAFFYLCTLAGVEVKLVFGDVIGADKRPIPHAWNIVKIEGDWYQIDVTWDDPILVNGENIKIYHYFNITNEEMRSDHIWNEKEYPISNNIKYNYYIINNLAVEGKNELKEALKLNLNNKNNELEYKMLNEKLTWDQAVSLINSMQRLKEYYCYVDEIKGIIKLTNLVYQ